MSAAVNAIESFRLGCYRQRAVKNLAWLSVIALLLVPSATGHPPQRHGRVDLGVQVCDKAISFTRTLTNTSLTSLGGSLGRRRLHYWNESPSTSYLYGVNTFVRISMSGRTLSFRAVRLVPVCAPLTITYSW
jgi:hypothetical protein